MSRVTPFNWKVVQFPRLFARSWWPGAQQRAGVVPQEEDLGARSLRTIHTQTPQPRSQ